MDGDCPTIQMLESGPMKFKVMLESSMLELCGDKMQDIECDFIKKSTMVELVRDETKKIQG